MYCNVWQWDTRTFGSCYIGIVPNVTAVDCPWGPEGAFLSQGREDPPKPVYAEDSICVATRVDQMWQNGLVLCINIQGQWNLTTGGPPLQGRRVEAPQVVRSGYVAPLNRGSWYALALTTELGKAWGTLDSQSLFQGADVDDLDTGFAALGTNGWWPAEFRNFSLKKANSSGGWQPPSQCAQPTIGQSLVAAPCARNGLVASEQTWNLLPSFQLQHVGSGLCAAANGENSVTLQTCNSKRQEQLFVNDYTNIRNNAVPLMVASLKKPLAGMLTGEITLSDSPPAHWSKWSYFPNTKQLRNQYVAKPELGYPMCLSTCSRASPEIVTFV